MVGRWNRIWDHGRWEGLEGLEGLYGGSDSTEEACSMRCVCVCTLPPKILMIVALNVTFTPSSHIPSRRRSVSSILIFSLGRDYDAPELPRAHTIDDLQSNRRRAGAHQHEPP